VSVEEFARDLANRGRNAEAAEAWAALAEVRPEEPKYWGSLAMERVKLNDLPAAGEALERGISVATGDEQTELSEVLEAIRRREQAAS
jgi:hypothetical protein